MILKIIPPRKIDREIKGFFARVKNNMCQKFFKAQRNLAFIFKLSQSRIAGLLQIGAGGFDLIPNLMNFPASTAVQQSLAHHGARQTNAKEN